MFGLSYIKVDPNFFVIHYSNGKIRRQGRGLAFFYFQPTSSIVTVPVASVDVPFIFNELTADYQDVTLQGQITYKVGDPVRLSQNLNYTVRGQTARYVSDDPEKLSQRIVNFAQVLARPEVQHVPLKTALHATESISVGVMQAIRAADAFRELGVEIVAFSLLAIRPTPEMSKAIEAEAREALQKHADEAISERRNAAVDQERRIKENELLTEETIQNKEQLLAQALLASEIELEQKKEALVTARAANVRQEADAQAHALRASLEPLRALDPKALEVISASRTDPRVVVALALKELAADASRIGQLNLTPDLLSTLLEQREPALPKE